MFRHASIIFGHHPIFPWRGRSGQKIFFEHEIFDGFQYWFDILGNRFGCVVAADQQPLSCTAQEIHRRPAVTVEGLKIWLYTNS